MQTYPCGLLVHVSRHRSSAKRLPAILAVNTPIRGYPNLKTLAWLSAVI